jgi:sulfane dehydrogenase subunit SoxC
VRGRNGGQPVPLTDETGYWEPTREELVEVRGLNATDHYNGIKIWYVHKDGKVTHE